jgi:hypothetical protein
MAPAEEVSLTTAPAGLFSARGILRRASERLASRTTRTRHRVENDVAREAARRIRTMAILTGLTVVAVAVLQHLLQPELAAAHQAPLFRLSALFLAPGWRNRNEAHTPDWSRRFLTFSNWALPQSSCFPYFSSTLRTRQRPHELLGLLAGLVCVRHQAYSSRQEPPGGGR